MTQPTHPHNANPSDYVAALDACRLLAQAGFMAEQAGFRLTFNTIEATCARRDAVELGRLISAARDAISAAEAAAHDVLRNSKHRTETLARVEAR